MKMCKKPLAATFTLFSLGLMASTGWAQTGTGETRTTSEASGEMRESLGRNNTYPIQRGVGADTSAQQQHPEAGDARVTNRDVREDQDELVESGDDSVEMSEISRKHAGKADHDN